MSKNPITAYETFWDTLLPSYTISKGEMRLPIATKLISFSDFNHDVITQELQSVLQTLLDTAGNENKAKERAEANKDFHLLPLIDSDYTGIVRFDCIWNEKTSSVKILEINCDYPDGLILHDATYGALSETSNSLHGSLLKQLFSNQESIHILHSPKAVFLDGYYAEYNTLQELGGKVTIGSDENAIAPTQTVKRCLETTKISPAGAEILAQKNSRFVNSFALRTLGYKSLLADMNHPFVPRTKLITEATIKECLSERENLVIKPADGCEGYGVYFGRDFLVSDWKKLIYSLSDKNYVMQELVEIPKLNVSLYENGTIVDKELYFDLCPHFFIKNGQVIGNGHTLMRFSEQKIVNVSQGGGIGYYKL